MNIRRNALVISLLVATLPATVAMAAPGSPARPLPPAADVPEDTWNPASSYAGGCIVIFQGKYYKAQWYAEPGQSPADADPNEPWRSPWMSTAPAEPTCGTGPVDPEPGRKKLTRSELIAEEVKLTDFPVMQQVLASIRTLGNDDVEAVEAGRPENPANVRRVESLLDARQFDYLFPLRAPEYTYLGLLQAFAKFPAVCADYADGRDADLICRRTLATMMAHFAQETGGHDAHAGVPEWRQGLVHVREMGWNEETPDGYAGECNPDTWQGKTWPCGTFTTGPNAGRFKSYFGRGAKQLSYNYNYRPFSDAMFGSVRPLLDHPERVADTWLNLASAVFFYMYPQPPKPSMLHVIDGTWQPNDRDASNGLVPGFGVTTQIINGGVECGGSTENAQSLNRIAYYKEAARYFNVPIAGDEVLGCKGMKQFDEGGAGAVPIYWEEDFSWVPENPEGRSFKCKLVAYQTPHTALKEGDYANCVIAKFPEAEIIEDLPPR